MNSETEVTTSPTDDGLSANWVETHADYLFNFAVGQLRDSGAAEDAVQETMLAAVKSSRRFSGQSSERTWLVGILRHKIYDHLRRACRERAVRAEPMPARAGGRDGEEAALWLHDVAAECQSPNRRMELGELREALEAAVGKLPLRLAQVFTLYEMEEQSNREVCQRLNISESNLWVMVHRARKQLRQELAGWWNGDVSSN
ncbi:MAG TPA: sigma-70 family RNA polymerase sigma factor [Verrucomicrobiae bacterium]|nr:sigma-70 family RNA polymerase sigma factor [Verrucomicrobiae bacterium]